MKSVYFITIQKKHIVRSIVFLVLTILFILLMGTFISIKKAATFLPISNTEVIAHLPLKYK